MIVFTAHALLQLKNRRISQAAILKTIENPEAIIKSFRERMIYRKSYKRGLLDVILIREKSDIIIITAFYRFKYSYEN